MRQSVRNESLQFNATRSVLFTSRPPPCIANGIPLQIIRWQLWRARSPLPHETCPFVLTACVMPARGAERRGVASRGTSSSSNSQSTAPHWLVLSPRRLPVFFILRSRLAKDKTFLLQSQDGLVGRTSTDLCPLFSALTLLSTRPGTRSRLLPPTSSSSLQPSSPFNPSSVYVDLRLLDLPRPVCGVGNWRQ